MPCWQARGLALNPNWAHQHHRRFTSTHLLAGLCGICNGEGLAIAEVHSATKVAIGAKEVEYADSKRRHV